MHPNIPSATFSIIQNTSYRFFFASNPIKSHYFFKNISWNKFKITVEHPFFTKTTFETLLTAPLVTNISKHRILIKSIKTNKIFCKNTTNFIKNTIFLIKKAKIIFQNNFLNINTCLHQPLFF